MKVVIIGGVAGGATAAARLRRLEESAEIILLERSGFISYANCGLPYYIGGVIGDKQALTLQTPESFWARFRIDARVRHEALFIDRKAKTVTIQRLEDGSVYVERYDKLILSPGAKAIRPGIPGAQDERVLTLRTVEDAFAIREALERGRPESALVIGGGFVGLEAAENIMTLGVPTTILQLDDQILPPLDLDMACHAHAWLRKNGLKLRLKAEAVRLERTERGMRAHLRDGGSLEAELIVLAVGVMPESELARAAGLALGLKNAIAVNERMQTSDPDIYAVGDAVEVRQFVSGERALVPLAGPANKQGRIAANDICGRRSAFHGTQGSSIIRMLGMTVASTGLNEKMAQSAGVAYDKAVTFSASHATYFPGASNMTVKTLFAPETGRILGAQIVGFDGVDKRIDVLATAIRAGMTAAELEELELAYAPPYSSAKDPVNMAGFVIGNILAGLVKQFHWHEAEALRERDDTFFLDVRTQGEFARGCLPGAVNIPLDELRQRIGELPQDRTLLVNCQSGVRSYIACRILSGHGFDCRNLSGGYRFYEQAVMDACFDDALAQPCGMRGGSGPRG